MKSYLFLISMILALCACSDKSYKIENDNFLLGMNGHLQGSTVEGNLISTAIKEVHDLDIVFYPSLLIKKNQTAFLSTQNTIASNDYNGDIFAFYPDGIKDQFLVGNLKGKEIKKFVLARASENFDTDLQVAGMKYHINFTGGWPDYAYYSNENGHELKDEKVYRVAVSKFYYFSGQTFPSYKYRNGLGLRNFVETSFISAKESLKYYLSSGQDWPYLKEPRAKVTRSYGDDIGFKPIPEIQGEGHMSPYLGNTVTTRGIVTAYGSVEWYPGGEEAIIQTVIDDGNPLRSKAIHLHFKNLDFPLELGDELEVRGVVYEQYFDSGLSKTSIRDIKSFKVLKKNVPLPNPIRLGHGGRKIPNHVTSSWNGNVNERPKLDLNDGLDFWESLEGMRVVINNPRIVGFRGGNEEFFRNKPKGYLNLYVVADGNDKLYQTTPAGGVVIDQEQDNFNPGIIQILSNHFSRGIETNAYYDVGGLLEGDVVGNLGYESNIFGSAEYAMVLPEPQKVIQNFAATHKTKTPLEERPITKLEALHERQLTYAVFNVENLAGNQKDRLLEIGKSISVNLKCPDIVNFLEVQDVNGEDFVYSQGGDETLRRLIRHIDCGENIHYQMINIEPFMNNEGGQPGGNIRVAMIYNANKVKFTPRGNPATDMDTFLTQDGSLATNPSRLFANDRTFDNTRRSLVVEFEFRGEKIFAIGNHLNSKHGDTSQWGAMQPVDYRSDQKRQKLTQKIASFLKLLMIQAPNAHIITSGDFNALTFDESLKIIEANDMTNLIKKIPFNERYSYNYNGNSQLIDHIFVNDNLLHKNPEIEIIHINTDFMGQISDHDPVVSRFSF